MIEETTQIWVGTQPNPDDRTILTISLAEDAKIPPRGSDGQATITDVNGHTYTVRRVPCSLHGCKCALEFVG